MATRDPKRFPIDKQTAMSLLRTLRGAGVRHETHLRLGKRADLHLVETQQDLICELLSFSDDADKAFLTLRTSKPEA